MFYHLITVQWQWRKHIASPSLASLIAISGHICFQWRCLCQLSLTCISDCYFRAYLFPVEMSMPAIPHLHLWLLFQGISVSSGDVYASYPLLASLIAISGNICFQWRCLCQLSFTCFSDCYFRAYLFPVEMYMPAFPHLHLWLLFQGISVSSGDAFASYPSLASLIAISGHICFQWRCLCQLSLTCISDCYFRAYLFPVEMSMPAIPHLHLWLLFQGISVSSGDVYASYPLLASLIAISGNICFQWRCLCQLSFTCFSDCYFRAYLFPVEMYMPAFPHLHLWLQFQGISASSGDVYANYPSLASLIAISGHICFLWRCLYQLSLTCISDCNFRAYLLQVEMSIPAIPHLHLWLLFQGISVSIGDVYASYLPLAHMLERTLAVSSLFLFQ